MKSSKSLLLLVFWLTAQLSFSQIRFSTDSLVFANNISGTTDSLAFYIVNTSNKTQIIEDIQYFHPEFSLSDTALSIAAYDSALVYVYIHSKHNINYQDYLYIIQENNTKHYSIPLFAKVNYANSYYNATQNKWHEDLKSALKTVTGNGYVNLGYNTARDRMYMDIDNEKANGQGSAENRLECVYTGREAVNYTSRTDCQTNYSFNTEHTYPQGLFSQVEPQRADLHHLFPTDDATNNARGNSPFGIVTNPTGSNGGSKWTSTLFEPRDVQKGKSARAMLYFVVRYQDYSNYLAQNETLMRNWCLTYLPDSIEKRRNNDIHLYQKNRNPFIDYPQFLERIASITSTNNGTQAAKIYVSGNELNFDTTSLNGKTLQLYISNQGNTNLTLSNFQFSNNVFTFENTFDSILKPDSVLVLPIKFSPSAFNTYSGTLQFNTTDATTTTATINLHAVASEVNGIKTNASKPKLVLYPNPATNQLSIAGAYLANDVEIYNALGVLVKKLILNPSRNIGTSPPKEKDLLSVTEIDISDFPKGIYLVKVGNESVKLIKE
jgi:hypothetical protein